MNGPLELHIDLWFTFLKESLVDGKHIVEVLGVLNQLFIELGHLRIDVGRLIGGQAGVGGDGEEAELFLANNNTNIKGSHGCLL